MRNVRGKGERGKEADRLSAKPTYHKPRCSVVSGGKGGKRERTSFTHKVRHLQVIPTVKLSVIGPPVPFDLISQLSVPLAVSTVTA